MLVASLSKVPVTVTCPALLPLGVTVNKVLPTEVGSDEESLDCHIERQGEELPHQG